MNQQTDQRKTDWVRVTRAEPCPVCERPDWCARTADGTVVMCMRVESEFPVEKGGWIHRFTEPLPPVPAPKEVEKKADWTAECRRMYEHWLAVKKRRQVAKHLHVSIEALDRLRVGIGWDGWNGREFSSWPSRDHNGRCIGYIRRYKDGEKRTNRGGSTGVFYTHEWFGYPGPIYVVEGGSDVAACETLGISAIGRASNVHGGDLIRRLIRQHAPSKDIVVVGERDAKPEKRGTVASCPLECQGCAFCWPGLFGMQKVAAEIGGVGVMIPEPYKDMRDLLTKGGIVALKEIRTTLTEEQ